MTLAPHQREWLALAMLPGVGAVQFVRLLARFGSPGKVLGASQAALEEVVPRSLAERIRGYRGAVDVGAQERALGEFGARLVTMDDPDYPEALAEIYSPPLVLFVRGDIRAASACGVAIVGTRKPSPYGLRAAEYLARDLAAHGVTVISGMAQGIDAAAHRGALDAGGRTIAVLGCGTDIAFPRQHAALMEEIIANGCVISQFPFGMKPLAGNFPQRNRIISGLAQGVAVVEAAPRSGALITARAAAEQGREVFAVPGMITERNAQGPHALIQQGAKLVQNAQDIIVELNFDPLHAQAVPEAPPAPAAPAPSADAQPPRQTAPPPGPSQPRAQPAASGVEKDILDALAPDGSFVDEIALVCRIPVSEALSTLTLLELKGLVRQFSGKRFAPR